MDRTFDLCVLDMDSVTDGDQPVVRLWGLRNGEFTVVLDRGFEPYFYVEPKENLSEREVESLRKRLLETDAEGEKPRRIDAIKRKFLGKERRFLNVVMETPANVPAFREVVKEWEGIREEYEYTIPFYRRYMIDRGITPMGWVNISGRETTTRLHVDSAFELDSVKPMNGSGYPKVRVMAFDIEIAEEDGEERVIMLSMHDNNGFGKVLTYKNVKSRCVEVVGDEKALLERFMHYVKEKDPHFMVGYNTDGFDFPKLEQRCAKHKIELRLGRDDSAVVFRRRGRVNAAQVKGRVHIDLYNYVSNILSQTLTSEVLTLDRVAREILGAGKKPLEMSDIQDMWKSDLKGLVEYCLNDSVITMRLADHLLPQIFEVCRITGQTPFDASRMTYSQLVEWVLMRHAYKQGEMIPNRPKYKEVVARKKAPPYTGAYVHPPKEGIHDNIAVFDFRSLYPSIIVSHNISPETLDCGCCKGRNKVPEGEHYYCTRNKGFIPGILDGIISKRVETQNRMRKCVQDSAECRRLYNQQFSFKILSNAFYGYYGYAASRWYSRVCAESITSWGRYYIKDVIRKAESSGFEVVYGDTDSLFLKMRLKKNIREFVDSVNESLPGIMELEFKDLYKRGIFIEAKTGMAAKKKYALLDQKDSLVMRGLETRRRDWSVIAKKTQEKVLTAVLRDASPQKAVAVVHETIRKLMEGEVRMEDLVIYTQLVKRMDDYEQIGPHVAAARKAIKRGRHVGEGSVIAYVITKGSGSISDRAEPIDDAKDYDPEYYVHHQVIPPALRILSGLGVKEEDLTKEQSSLEKFLKKKKR